MATQGNNPAGVPRQDYISDLTASFELDPAKVALIVVDMQYATGSRQWGLGKNLREQGQEELGRYRFDRIEQVVVPNLQKLLAFFRRHKLRIIYLTVGSEMPDYSDLPPHMQTLARSTRNTRGFKEHEIIDELKPQEGELVLNKTTISAFTSTGLDATLRAMGVEYLLFGGVSTNMCVDTTARDAADRGYRCVLVEDCCGAAKEEYHLATLVNFQRLFGRVLSTEQAIAELEGKLAPAAV